MKAREANLHQLSRESCFVLSMGLFDFNCTPHFLLHVKKGPGGYFISERRMSDCRRCYRSQGLCPWCWMLSVPSLLGWKVSNLSLLLWFNSPRRPLDLNALPAESRHSGFTSLTADRHLDGVLLCGKGQKLWFLCWHKIYFLQGWLAANTLWTLVQSDSMFYSESPLSVFAPFLIVYPPASNPPESPFAWSLCAFPRSGFVLCSLSLVWIPVRSWICIFALVINPSSLLPRFCSPEPRLSH